MHTLFTVMVYAALAIGSRYNKSDLAIWLKIGACFLTVFIFWDIKPSEWGAGGRWDDGKKERKNTPWAWIEGAHWGGGTERLRVPHA